MVEAMLAVFPELDPLWRDAIAAPMGWAWHVLPFITHAHLFKSRLKGFAAVQRFGLERCPSAKLRVPTARGEIGVGFRCADLRDRAFNADLLTF